MSRHPEVKWAQRVDEVYVTVILPDAKSVKTNLEPEGNFTFSATAGAENHLYELKLELFDKVNVEESKINIGVRNISCVIKKAEPGWWKKLLRGDGKPPHYVKVDWDRWVDEDEDNAPPADFDMGGMDFSSFGGMDGMGGGMPGGMDDFPDDSDDEGQEVTKPEPAKDAVTEADGQEAEKEVESAGKSETAAST